MRAVNTCDFCGEPAVGVFEIVPESLEPSEREQRRTALCESCQHRLETLLEPLIERATGGSRPDTATRTVDSSQSASVESDQDTGNGGVVDGSDGSGSETEPAAGGERGKPSTPLDDEPGGVLLEPDSDSSDESVSSETHPSTADDAATESDTPPRAYGKVRRLLRNREFPMARADVEGLAAGAYELERHEVDAIIEYALEQGEFVESGGELRRT